jgi:hypothetical protein
MRGTRKVRLHGPDKIRSRLRAAAGVPRRCYHFCFVALPLAPAQQTAKPSAVRSQRLCLRPPKPYRAPNPSHGIGRVVELAAEGDQPDEEKHSVGAVTFKPLF